MRIPTENINKSPIFYSPIFRKNYIPKNLESQKKTDSQQPEGKITAVSMIIGLVVLMSMNSLMLQQKENQPKNALNKNNEVTDSLIASVR